MQVEDLLLRLSDVSFKLTQRCHLRVLVVRALESMCPAIELQVILKLGAEMVNGKGADVLIKVASHALNSGENIGEVSMDGRVLFPKESVISWLT